MYTKTHRTSEALTIISHFFFFSSLSLQQQVINISRTAAVPQIHVQAEQSLQPVALKQAAVSAKLTSDQPRILYQCGDCDELFKSLDLWQQHRKEEICHQSKSKPDPQPEPETASAQSSNSTLNPDDSSLSTSETSNLKLEPLEKPVAEEEGQQVADTFSAQSSDPPVSETAASTSNPEDSSPKKRGANKKPKPEPVLLCVDCGSCFGLVSELVAHRKTQHGFEEALHRCSVCGESFLNTTLFLYHRKQHRQKGEEKAVVVPEETSEEVCIQSNRTEEQEQGQGQDATPSTTSATSSFTHPELFMCTQCGQSFSDEGGLVTHRKQKHDLKEPLHSCSHCGESFMNTTQYLYHRRQHRFTLGTEVTDGAETGDETATIKPQDTPQSSKRLISPPASASESGSPLPKRSKPSFRILSGVHSLKGKQKYVLKPIWEKIRHLLQDALVPNEQVFVLSGNKSSGTKEESEGSTAADSDNTNHPPPAKLLQDWARTPLPHVCPYCGKTFTRRVFLRTHVYSHTGEKLFTCKVPIKIEFVLS